MVKNPPAMWETWAQSLGWEGPLEEGMATHSSILAWRIPMDRGAWQTTVDRAAESWHDRVTKHVNFLMKKILIYILKRRVEGNLGKCVLKSGKMCFEFNVNRTKCDMSLFLKYEKLNNNSYVLNLNLFLTFTSMVFHYYDYYSFNLQILTVNNFNVWPWQWYFH